MNSLASDSLTLRVQAEQIADAYLPTNGRPSGLADPNILQLLLAAITDGVSYESACKSAGIAPRTIYNWKTRAERGDEAAMAFVQALEKAEADVERKAVRNTLKAGEKDAFWAANMTFLERRYPERWGRRQDESNGPKVVVQIGVQASDVRVHIGPFASNPSTVSEDMHSLTGDVVSDNRAYVEPAPSVPAAVIEPVRPARRATRGGTLPGAEGPLPARRRVTQGKAKAAGGKKKGVPSA